MTVRSTALFTSGADLGMRVDLCPLMTETREGQIALDTVDAGATALVCWQDIPAKYSYASCGHVGIRVPEPLALIRFDDVTPGIASRNPLPYDGACTTGGCRQDGGSLAGLSFDARARPAQDYLAGSAGSGESHMTNVSNPSQPLE